MALTHQLVTLNATPTLLTVAFANEPEYSKELIILVENMDQSKHALLGSSNVSTSSYGIRLDPGERIQLSLSPWDELYGVASTGTLSVGVVRIQK